MLVPTDLAGEEGNDGGGTLEVGDRPRVTPPEVPWLRLRRTGSPLPLLPLALLGGCGRLAPGLCDDDDEGIPAAFHTPFVIPGSPPGRIDGEAKSEPVDWNAEEELLDRLLWLLFVR